MTAVVRIYPDIPARRTATLLRDAAFVALLMLFAWIGLKVHDTVDQLAVLGSGLQEVGDNVPLVGGSIEDAGKSGERAVHRTANVLGLITFLLPALPVALFYVPRRTAQIQRLTAADHVLRGHAEPARRRFVAMRAAFGLPYGELLRHTDDPLGDLAAERYEALVEAALEAEGLRSP
jgi:hypothetical protein